MSPLPSALPNLINLDMGVMEPTNMKVEDQSAMVGLVFEPSEVLPEGPQLSGEHVVPDDPVTLLAEYNSVDEEMDVEVKDEPLIYEKLIEPFLKIVFSNLESRVPSSGTRGSGFGIYEKLIEIFLKIVLCISNIESESRVPSSEFRDSGFGTRH
ncbi:hypothetical protein EV702DRAFT_1045352 [Suillus placidus]|uniref:Uncharacterized protein n=1 Tax=Suillus placidus TaxID=48579 RepID=A0A9P7D3M2_9AGAM|nr:hypothetical protein EV702DRAFT_1045352 [Suillus placidus]